MKKAQQGFTILELMIAVGITGILAAIAIPAYDIYVGRAQAAEAFELLRGIKNPVEEYFNTTGTMPDVDSLYGIKTSGKYVKEIKKDQLDSHKYIAVFKSIGFVSPGLADMELEFSYDTSSGEWNCSGPANRQMYLPNTCKPSRAAAGAL